MKNKLSIFFVLFMFVVPKVAISKPVYKKINKGQEAPFTGVLLSFESFAKLAADKEATKKKHELDKKTLERKLKAEHKYQLNSCKLNLKVAKNICEQRLVIHKDRYQMCLKSQPNSLLYGFLGYLLGAGTVIGAGYALGGISNAFK